MTRSRDIRAQRRHADERDHSWQEARDDDLDAADVPEDEYQGIDEAATMAKEFRG